jgi:adenine-specific DNA-methyltransferase
MLADIYAKSLAIASEDAEEVHEQFFTPPEIAEFMGSMFIFSDKDSIRLLDAGSGTGILGIGAAIQAIESGVSKVHLVCIETEKISLKLLRLNLKSFPKQNANFTYEILEIDYLQEHDIGDFDYIISNPPYSKITPKINRGGTSPNMYSRFMEVSIDLLSSNGQMVFIVPRSFTNGVYFKKFRKNLLTKLSTTQIHLFHSRKNIFTQQVLQETMIISLEKNSTSKFVSITSSTNRKDILEGAGLKISSELVELGENNDYRIAIPTTEIEVEVLELFNSWKGRFDDHGIEISTGPVVGFRSKKYLLKTSRKGSSYPMIWPTHVTLQAIDWPKKKCKKLQYIASSATDRIVPNQNYVILKRFTTKEEAKRLYTCPLKAGTLPGDFLGLENHLNYIHMGEKKMSFTLCKGISFMLNSTIFDTYIRIVNGQTQVNATDLENLSIPDLQIIKNLGKCISKNNDYSKALERLLNVASEKN